jgi:hypothetical protein
MEEFCLSSAGNKNTISAYETSVFETTNSLLIFRRSSQILIYGLRITLDVQSIIRGYK